MEYTISKHAEEQFTIRGITVKCIEEVMNHPDSIIEIETCKPTYHKIITEKNRKYLYRFFVNVCKYPPLIITGYKTSKIGKYEN